MSGDTFTAAESSLHAVEIAREGPASQPGLERWYAIHAQILLDGADAGNVCCKGREPWSGRRSRCSWPSNRRGIGGVLRRSSSSEVIHTGSYAQLPPACTRAPTPAGSAALRRDSASPPAPHKNRCSAVAQCSTLCSSSPHLFTWNRIERHAKGDPQKRG